MAFFSKKRKPTREEIILDTKVQLELLKDKYEKMMIVQRQILRKDPTPHEKEVAENKIRSGICAYTLANEASQQLDDIASELDLNQSLKVLSKQLKTVNKLGGKAKKGSGVLHKIDKQTEKLFEREKKTNPADMFDDKTLAAVDEWLGSRWEDVSQRYIADGSIKNVMRESRRIVESDPMPYFADYNEAFGGSGGAENYEDIESDLRGLMDSDIFS